MTLVGDKRVAARAAALLASGDLDLRHVGPQLVVADARTRAAGSRPERLWEVGWTPAGWSCTCDPRRPGPCSHVLALRGLLSAVAPDHAAGACDPWAQPARL